MTTDPQAGRGPHPFSGVPGPEFPVPDALTRGLGHGTFEVVWLNEVGGVTVRSEAGGRPVYAKWAPAGTELDLAAEADRLAWAAPYAAVPEVVDFVSGDDGDVLITAALPGGNAVTPRWRSEPEVAVHALGEGLRALHEALPVESCPYSWSAHVRIARSRADGIPERVAVLDRLAPAPEPDRLVVCHGDACAPNTLLAEDGTVTGHVDLGRLGVADRWADIAVGAWSTEWNYGPGFTGLYYEAYGVDPDEERIAYYRALWDAT